MNQPRIIDLDVLHRTREAIGPDKLRGIFEVMARTSHEEADIICNYIKNGDFSEAKRIAHGIVGGALSLGTCRLADAARAVEFAAPPTPEMGQALREAVSDTLKAIATFKV